MDAISYKKLGYFKTPTIIQMVTAIEDEQIFNELLLVQQTEFNNIKKMHINNQCIAPPYVNYLKTLYWNFVSNNFKFNKIVQKSATIHPAHKHIGMQMLEQLNKC